MKVYAEMLKKVISHHVVVKCTIFRTKSKYMNAIYQFLTNSIHIFRVVAPI